MFKHWLNHQCSAVAHDTPALDSDTGWTGDFSLRTACLEKGSHSNHTTNSTTHVQTVLGQNSGESGGGKKANRGGQRLYHPLPVI